MVAGPGLEYQWTGIYQVNCNWPVDAGADGAAQMVDQILRLFPRGLTIGTTDGLQVAIMYVTPIPVRAEGVWFRGAAKISWFSWEHK